MIEINGMEAEISALISDLEKSISDVNNNIQPAAYAAAEIIRNEQVRLLGKASFKRDKEKHLYNMVNGSLITIKQAKSARMFKLAIGYDTPTIQAYPELLVIEFGRPGKSSRRSKSTDTNGRKKGSFPSSVSHIRAGFFLAKDKAADKYNETLYKIVADDFKGR